MFLTMSRLYIHLFLLLNGLFTFCLSFLLISSAIFFILIGIRYYYSTFIFSAIRNFELLDLGLIFNSSADGTMGFLVIIFN